jgi:hypothetical protein
MSGWSFAKGFYALCDNIYDVSCYNRCHGNDVEGFRALRGMHDCVADSSGRAV